MADVESHRLSKDHTFLLKETLQLCIAEEANLCLLKVKTIMRNQNNLIVAGLNSYVYATYSVQSGWHDRNACCREGDNTSVIPPNHSYMEQQGLQTPFKSKWVAHVLQTAIEETPGILYQMMHKILKPFFNKYALSNNVLQEGQGKAKVDLFGNLDESI
jgi:hypothetical protein